MSKVTEVLDPTFRSGEKNGKVWVLSKVLTDDGKEATGFSLNVGDEVKLTYNDKFKNYSAEKLTAQKKQQEETEDTLKLILSALGRIERHLGITGIKEPEKPLQVGLPDNAPYGQEDHIIGPDEELKGVDYDSLPF